MPIWHRPRNGVKCFFGTKFPRDTFYLNLQCDEAMSRVLTESQCSEDEREIEWTIPVIGLSTHFSKALVIKTGTTGLESLSRN